MSKFSKSIDRFSDKSKNLLIVALLIYAAFTTPFLFGWINPPTYEIRETIREIQPCPSASSAPEPNVKPKTLKVRRVNDALCALMGT